MGMWMGRGSWVLLCGFIETISKYYLQFCQGGGIIMRAIWGIVLCIARKKERICGI